MLSFTRAGKDDFLVCVWRAKDECVQCKRGRVVVQKKACGVERERGLERGLRDQCVKMKKNRERLHKRMDLKRMKGARDEGRGKQKRKEEKRRQTEIGQGAGVCVSREREGKQTQKNNIKKNALAAEGGAACLNF